MPEIQTDTPMLSQPPLQSLKCSLCEIPLTFLEKVWNMRAAAYVRVFECPSCRKLTWYE
jgi:hypothetical protein